MAKKITDTEAVNQTSGLTGDDAQEGTGLHRIPTCVEVVISRLSVPFFKASTLVKLMSDDDKKFIVDSRNSKTDEDNKRFRSIWEKAVITQSTQLKAKQNVKIK